MKIIYGLNNLKFRKKKAIVTIGIFDGAHKAHQKILKETRALAKKQKIQSCIITFYPHPQKVLTNTPFKATITSLEHRLRLLQAIGIDLCVVIKFTSRFSKRSIPWFVENILKNKLKTQTLIVGSGFKIGREAVPTQTLKGLLARQGINFKIIPNQKYKNNVISSSFIRKLIEGGKLDIASKLLARPFAIYGTVVSGKQRGRTLGFRTANIDPHHEVMPPSGVYAVKVKLGKKHYKGVLNIGFCPTFKQRQKEPTIEVHILGFKGNLYKKDIEVFFVKKIRPERHFRNKEALKKQINKDILTIKSPRQ